MKHISMILLAWLGLQNQAGQNLYVCKNAKINLYSSAPIEDIKAQSNSGASVFDASAGVLEFTVAIHSFHFAKSLMEEHFNSDYMESDKFPNATFKGKIDRVIDISKDGLYEITATGDWTVHGVTQKRTIAGKMNINSGIVTLSAEFMVKCADHNIRIPTIVFHHIAESIQVDVSATYNLYKK